MHQSTSDAYRELIEIGIALSAESDPARLRERILMEAKAFTNADAGTLYLKHQGKELRFQIVRNDSLGIAMGGTTGVECDLPPVQLITAAGEPNVKNVASYCAISGEIVNLADAYCHSNLDFSGTQEFDRRLGYRSQSFLTVPLKNHGGVVIGVLQLINAKDAAGNVVPIPSSASSPPPSTPSRHTPAATASGCRSSRRCWCGPPATPRRGPSPDSTSPRKSGTSCGWPAGCTTAAR
jgi:hypothetical protein